MKESVQVKVYKEYTLCEQEDCYGKLVQVSDHLAMMHYVLEYQHECTNCGEKHWLEYVSPTTVYEEIQ
jgi:hypothetical protein